MLKRTFIIFLTAVIMTVFSVSGTVSVSAYSDPYLNAVKIVMGTGIMKPMQDGEFHGELAVTRGEMAEIIYNLYHPFGFSVGPVSKSKEFTDVTDPDLKEKVDFASSMNLMVGYNDKEFGAEHNLEYRQALKIFVTMLGYGELAQQLAPYPEGYIRYADEIGLTDGIVLQTDAAINRTTAARLIYRTITGKFVEKNFTSYGKYTYEAEKTLWERYFDIHYSSGILNQNEISSIGADNSVKPSTVEIDEELYYKDSGVNTIDLLGTKVDFFYSGRSEHTVHYIQPVSYSDKEYIRLEYNEISDFSDNTYKYKKDGKRASSLTFSKAANLIYNGRCVQTLTEEDFTPKYGYVEIYDSKKSGVYDLVKITSYTTVVANTYNEGNNTVYDKNRPSKSITFDPHSVKYCEIYDASGGKVIPEETIKSGDVLTLAVSKDKEIIRGYIAENREKITVRGYEETEDGIKITDEETFYTVPEYYSYDNISRLIGKQVAIYKDIFGKIVSIEETDNTKVFAYLTKFAYEEKSLNGGKLQLKFFEDSGDFKIYEAEDKLIVDGYKCKKPEEAYARLNTNLGGKNLSMCIISYDDSGRLLSIDTPYFDALNENIDKSLKQIYTAYDADYSVISDKKLYYRNSVHSFGGKITISNDTKLFMVPSKDTYELDEINCKINPITYISNDTEWAFEAYQAEQSYGYAPVIILYDRLKSDEVDTGIASAVVESNQWVNTKDYGGKGQLVYMMNGASRTSYYDEGDEVEKARPGDVIKVQTDKNNNIIAYQMFFDYSENKILEPSTDDLEGVNTNILGYVYSRYNNQITVAKDESLITQDYESVKDSLWHYDASGFRIYRFNPEEKTVSVVTSEFLRDYQHFGSDYSKIFMSTRYGHGRIIVVYE